MSVNSISGSDDVELIQCPMCPHPRFFKDSVPLWQTLGQLENAIPVLKRIPRSARPSVVASLSKCIEHVVRVNTPVSWAELLTFCYRILYISKNNNSSTLTQKIKENCRLNPFVGSISLPPFRLPNSNTSLKLIESKISDGDLREAANLLFSNDVVAVNCQETLSALKDKHPPPAPNLVLPPPPNTSNTHLLTKEEDISAAIFSFKSGSASDLDG
ncbi:hypothetical protein ACJJTC_019264, partial [Scirpophaga incertulas]